MFKLTVKDSNKPSREHSIIVSSESVESIAHFLTDHVIPMAFEAGSTYADNPIKVTVEKHPVGKPCCWGVRKQ